MQNGLRIAVLNAFRHQWNPHTGAGYDAGSLNGAQRLAASMESSLVAASQSAGIVQRAQRLSASMESSPLTERVAMSPVFRCSTPFGINGILTSDCSRDVTTPCMVLNAFRHQWNPHAGRPAHRAAWPRAQRLSASMESSRAVRWRRRCRIGMCSTPFGINGILTTATWRTVPPWRECSTPFGINGILTRWRVRCINARGWCSTPFGINGILTHMLIAAHDGAQRGAQRLSASMESSRCTTIAAVVS